MKYLKYILLVALFLALGAAGYHDGGGSFECDHSQGGGESGKTQVVTTGETK